MLAHLWRNLAQVDYAGPIVDSCVCDIHLPGETWGTYWDHGRRWVWRGRLSLSLFSSSPKWLLLSCLVSLNITLDARTPRRSILPPVCAYRPAQLTLITQRQYCSKRALCGRPAAPRAPHCFFFFFFSLFNVAVDRVDRLVALFFFYFYYSPVFTTTKKASSSFQL